MTWNPRRIAVAGVSGAGKTTLCDEIAELLDAPRVELDSLFNGPDWTPRESFVEDVEDFVAGPRWRWNTRHKYKPIVPAYETEYPCLTVIRLGSPSETKRWVSGLVETGGAR
ncbi:MAG: hypothetical protein ACTH1D_02555 [Mycobacteriaceae bacterium]|uniref:hypothetical protein n=1 Tax=Corynebacterium sp. TaxID=1720 RepID=UPI003F9C50CD